MMPHETVEIKIGGQIFHLRSTEGGEKLQEYARYANAKLTEVTDGSDTLSLRVALLALLNLSEELYTERESHRVLLEQIEGRAQKIKEYLDSMEA